MAHIKRTQPWEVPASRITGEREYWSRRRFLRDVGIGSLGGAAALGGLVTTEADAANRDGRASRATPSRTANRFDQPANFIEFSQWNAEVPELARRLSTANWSVSVGGHVEHPMNLAVGELIELMGEEERAYRFRCIEGWAMIVPWSGFPLRKLVERVRPTAAARHVRFVGFHDPDVAPGQRSEMYPWPYTEVLTLDEAAHELSFIATGVYGQDLPNAHGAPLRLVVPWKYATKSLKSVTRIEFIGHRPESFWQMARPDIIGQDCNVDPNDRIAGISQAEEIVIGTGEWQATQPFNGYADLVAGLRT